MVYLTDAKKETNQQKILRLKTELASYDKINSKQIEKMKERNEIKRLQKEIREKKYADVKQVGKNIKVIGKNIGKGFKAVGKGMGEFVGDPAKDKDKFDMDKLLRDLPQ